MATVTVGPSLVLDETGRKDSRDWQVYSPVYRAGSDGSVVTTRHRTIRVVAGIFTAKLEPGLCVVQNPDGQKYTITVPNTDADLWDLIAAAVAFPPNTEAELLADAVTAYLEDNPPEADWNGLINMPAVIAEGATQSDARSAIGAASTTSVTTAQTTANAASTAASVADGKAVAAQATADAAVVASQKVAATWAETTDKQAAAVRPSLVVIGDSFTAKAYASTAWNGSSYSRISSYYADSYLTAAMVWNRWPCTLIPTGVTGQQSNAGLARFDTDVTPKRPHVVIEEYGSNDIVSDRTAAATFADRLAMWGKAWKFGAKVIATTCPPRNAFTTAQMKEALKLNTMLRNFAATNPQDFALVDIWAVLADPATGQFKSGYSTDGTHPNTQGCWPVGQAFEAAFDRFFPAATTNLAMVNVNDDNLLANPLMITPSGVIASNKGLTGAVAQSWVGTSGGTDANTAAVMSLVARSDGFGYWQQITTTTIPDSSTTVALFQDCGTGAVAANDILQACVEFETDAAGWTNGKLDLTLTCMSADSLTAYSHTGSFNPGGDSIINTRPEAGVLRTPPIVVPSGTTHLFLNAVVGGLGTVRFGRPAIRKLAA